MTTKGRNEITSAKKIREAYDREGQLNTVVSYDKDPFYNTDL